jgi:hypothetical protein
MTSGAPDNPFVASCRLPNSRFLSVAVIAPWEMSTYQMTFDVSAAARSLCV